MKTVKKLALKVAYLRHFFSLSAARLLKTAQHLFSNLCIKWCNTIELLIPKNTFKIGILIMFILSMANIKIKKGFLLFFSF